MENHNFGGEKMKKETKTTVTMWVMAVLLLIALTYIVNGMYQQSKRDKQAEIYQMGARDGYEQAVVEVIQQAATCRQVPLSVRNVTINIVAVECLERAEPEVVKSGSRSSSVVIEEE